MRTLKGWFESKDPFDAKLLCWTLLRNAIQGAAWGYGLNQDPFAAFFETLAGDWLVTNRTLDKIGEKVGVKTS